MIVLLVLMLAAVAGALGVVVTRRSPRIAFAVWAGILCFAPFWAGADVGVFVPAVSVAAALIVASLFSSTRPDVGAIDVLMVVIVVIYAAGMLVADATIATGFVLVAHWAVGYLFGRSVVAPVGLGFVYDAVAVAFCVVAVIAVAEFLTGLNVFHRLRLDNSAYAGWSGQQFRGGNPRAEAGFGHSIALGCSIAMAIPLVIASRFREWKRAVMVVVLLTGVVVTFSRTAMICSVLSLVLTVVFLKGALPFRTRVGLLLGASAVAVVVGPLVISTFVEAGSEATGSSAYRGDLLTLVPTMQPLGLSSAAYRSAAGDFYFAGFRSIDSALILLGLTHGYITLAIVLVLLTAAGCYVVSGRATAPTIAVVAQLPALATVALITQYGIWFWVICGLAVASQLERSRAADPEAPESARVAATIDAGGTTPRAATAGRTRHEQSRDGLLPHTER